MSATLKQPELMAPAGGMDSLAAALKAGADSVYFGVGDLNMRSRASANFAVSDIPEVVRKCRTFGAKAYLALNTIIYDSDMDAMRRICDAAKIAGVDAVIASDMAVFSYLNSIGLSAHVSVQTNVANLETARFFAKFADVVVLARELTLPQIKHIVSAIELEKITGLSGELLRVELFIHGALCVSVSGKCQMSLATYNSSGNRGACLQNCRRRYRVVDDETGDELVVDNEFVMSPKDICMIRVMNQLAAAGISIFKLEGRGRSADYVSVVTGVYREALDALTEGAYSSAGFADWEERLAKVFNRGFWHGGYYLGETTEMWSGYSGNRVVEKKTHIGRVTNYFAKIAVAELTLSAGGLKNGDQLVVIGPTTGAAGFAVSGLRLDDEPVDSAEKGDVVSLSVPEKVRRGDKVYLYDLC
ncbi:MAG: U32 family peptidase [Kiritimatiellaeota bacterium]|nr:U32 family peptidase [Kiritimatiellota bacterium]